MVRQATLVITLLAMLLHSSLGCGWHHAHAAEGHGVLCAAEARGPLASGHHACRHHADGRNCSSSSHRSPCEGSRGCGSEDASSSDLVTSDEHDAEAIACDNNGESPWTPLHRCFEDECRYLPASPVQPPISNQVAIGWLQVDAVTSLNALLCLGAPRVFTKWPALTFLPYLPRCEVTRVWLI